MENEFKLDKIDNEIEILDLFPSKSDIIPIIKTYKNKSSKNFLSKKSKKYHRINKFYSTEQKKFMNNKIKEKNNIGMLMPQTPHNTGQYLSHIHQEFDSKKKPTQSCTNLDNLGIKEEINGFEDDCDEESLGNFDFQFIEDKKRDRLMSMEGKELHDFLFKPDEKKDEDKKEGNKNEMKLSFDFDEAEENEDLCLDMKNTKSSKF